MYLLFKHLWKILRLFGLNWDSRFCVFLYACVLSLELSTILVSVRMIQWTADFYSALEEFDGDAALFQVGVFGLLVLIYTSIRVSANYLKKFLVMNWRQNLTQRVLDNWLSDTVYWRLQNGFSGTVIDNPDQRIADDCRLFVEEFVDETLSLISSVTGLFSYVYVLWSLSDFALPLGFIGLDMEIPRYMVFSAFIYVLLASCLAHGLGYRLKGLYFQQQKKEADFRFSMVRFRENSDSIAMGQATTAERKRFDNRFAAIVSNWRALIFQEFLFGCFNTPYFYTVLRIPLLLALPAFFAGYVKLGGLMQLAGAFQRVVTTLSYFIFAYKRLSKLAATTTRLGEMLFSIEACSGPHKGPQVMRTNNPGIAVSALSLQTPQGSPLNLPRTISFAAGEHVWISGPSGLGKTTLFKAITGIWPFGNGVIHVPQDHQFSVISQKSNFPDAPLSECACYPENPSGLETDELCRYLRLVGLRGLAARLQQGEDTGIEGLSGGERQRLAFVALLIRKPEWVFLDEATSAIDMATEQELFTQLQKELPNTTFIMIAHREPKGFIDLRHLRFGDEESNAA